MLNEFVVSHLISQAPINQGPQGMFGFNTGLCIHISVNIKITALVTMDYSWHSIPANLLFHDHPGYCLMIR